MPTEKTTTSRRQRIRRFALAAALVSAAPVDARAAGPQELAVADALFTEATRLIEAGRHAAAVPKLQEVIRIDPSLTGAKYNLALCYEVLGQLVTAWSTWLDVEFASRDVGNEERRKTAAERLVELKPRLSTLTIAIPEHVRQTRGIQVRRDGLNIGSAQWGVAVPVDGGKHTVTVTAPGKMAWQQTVDIPRERGRVLVEVTAMADKVPPPTPVWRDVWTLVGTGTGLGLIVVSIPFWVEADRRIAKQNEQCDHENGVANCHDTFDFYGNRSEMVANYATFFGFLSAGGVALAAVGTRIALTPSASTSSKPKVAITPVPWLSMEVTGMGVVGAF